MGTVGLTIGIGLLFGTSRFRTEFCLQKQEVGGQNYGEKGQKGDCSESDLAPESGFSHLRLDEDRTPGRPTVS